MTVAHARRTDPETSHSAAKSVGKVAELQREILALFHRYGPTTDRTLVERHEDAYFGPTPQNIRSRRSELCKMGRVRDSGKREIPVGGKRPYVVWELTPTRSE